MPKIAYSWPTSSANFRTNSMTLNSSAVMSHLYAFEKFTCHFPFSLLSLSLLLVPNWEAFSFPIICAASINIGDSVTRRLLVRFVWLWLIGICSQSCVQTVFFVSIALRIFWTKPKQNRPKEVTARFQILRFHTFPFMLKWRTPWTFDGGYRMPRKDCSVKTAEFNHLLIRPS